MTILWRPGDNPQCAYVNHGWGHAETWCTLLAQCHLPLDDSPTGSRARIHSF